MRYAFVEDDRLEDAIIRDIRLDHAKVIDRFGSAREFFQQRIHIGMFHNVIDGYGKNTRPYKGVIGAINELQKQGLSLEVITARTIRLESIEEYSRDFVDEHFGKEVPIYRVESTKEKEPHLEKAAAWLDDSYHSIVEFLEEKNIYVVRRTMLHNKNLPFDAEITSVHSDDQPWVEHVLDHCMETGKKDFATDLDDTVTSFRARIAQAVRLYAKTHQAEVKELRKK